MRIISQRIKDAQSEWPKRVMCENCQAELEIEESDVFVGEFGCHLFKCPCCNKTSHIDGFDRDTPPIFRKTFFHYSATKDGTVQSKHIPDDEIQRMINKCVSNLISDDVEADKYTMEATGDTAVYAFKMENCIDIIVTQDYYEDTLFEDDYGLIREED